jgi:hypothetical protein
VDINTKITLLQAVQSASTYNLAVSLIKERQEKSHTVGFSNQQTLLEGCIIMIIVKEDKHVENINWSLYTRNNPRNSP